MRRSTSGSWGPRSSYEDLRTSGKTCHPKPQPVRRRWPSDVVRMFAVARSGERRISAAWSQYSMRTAEILRASIKCRDSNDGFSMAGVLSAKRGSE
jgi:hypothetical protein